MELPPKIFFPLCLCLVIKSQLICVKLAKQSTLLSAYQIVERCVYGICVKTYLEISLGPGVGGGGGKCEALWEGPDDFPPYISFLVVWNPLFICPVTR
jgi:hypothetical protein